MLLLVIAAPLHAAAQEVSQRHNVRKLDMPRRRVLVLTSRDHTSDTAGRDSERAVDVFVQVIQSYWNLEATTLDLHETSPSEIDEYDVILVSDEWGETPSPELVDKLLTVQNKQIVWFGFNGSTMLASVLRTKIIDFPVPIKMEGVRYKDVLLPNVKGVEWSLLYGLGNTQSMIPWTAPVVSSGAPEGLPAAISVDKYATSVKSDFLFFPFVIPRYFSAQSYTNAMLDLLHGPLGEPLTQPSKQALVRLEDVNGYTYSAPSNTFFDTTRYFEEQGIPYHIALIERYIHPEREIDNVTKDFRHFNYILHKVVGLNQAVLIQHGYTHQIKNEVSAAGYEFWDIDTNSAVAGDSEQYVIDKISAAQASMRANNFDPPEIWETPHYQESALDTEVLNKLYKLRYDHPSGIGSFPFTVMIDDVVYFPENLGYIEKGWDTELPAFKQRFERLQVFSHPTPSFFWHPWRKVHEVVELTDIVRSSGFEFVSAYDLLELREEEVLGAQNQNPYMAARSYVLINATVLFLYGLFAFGLLIYIRDFYYFHRHYRKSLKFSMTRKLLMKYVRARKTTLPHFVVFVPARNEGRVIANTITRLRQLDYAKTHIQFVVITDAREKDDSVDVLTHDEVSRIAKRFNGRRKNKLVVHIDVPKWYSGTYGSKKRTHQKSTKGRALNYALQTYHPPKSWKGKVYFGVLDADGRLHEDILKEAALKIVTTQTKILQGPVFQISNLNHVSLIGVMAGLELSRYHLTEMLRRLNKKGKFQFLAGTNYFIERDLIRGIGGWDQHALVEDAELAIRAYNQAGEVASALSLPEIEQTPPNLRVYIKQRERWARGHMYLIPDIVRAKIPITVKISFIRKVCVSQARFILDFGLPILAVVFLFRGYFREVEPWLQIFSSALLVGNFVIWDAYGYTFRKLVKHSDVQPRLHTKLIMSVRLLLFMPLLVIIQAIPRLKALSNVIFRRQVAWYKTERTKEAAI